MKCPACANEIPPGFRFCGNCGKSLSDGVPVVPSAPAATPASRDAESERRQLTVMFCDLVGSATLGDDVDPEELREIVRDYQAACAAAVAPFGGHVAQYLGDGMLIYFGYPVASEDSPRRGVHGGLAVVEAVARLTERSPARRDGPLTVRVGIHTGAVVTGSVGEDGRGEKLAIGSAMNLAARLPALADPGAVVLSGTTYRLVEGFFECRSLGMVQLKGLTQPVEAYRALRATGAVSRFEVTASRGLVPPVGRVHELESLLGGFERARVGTGLAIAVVGEPGIGKSRLMEMFRERLAQQPHVWRVCRCSPYGNRSALQPVVEMLEQRCGIDRDTPKPARREKLTQALATLGPLQADTLPLMAALLSLPPGPDEAPLSLSPERQRQRTLETLVEIVLALAARETLVLAVEDVHWADPSTVELLTLIAERARSATLLMLVLHRPGLALPWAHHEGAMEIALGPLSEDDVAAIIGHVTAGRELPRELLRQLVAKTDGVPLFVEELTKMILESGQDLQRPTTLTIPTTLRDSLVARLDRLGTAKEIAQVGAVLGREFSYEMLRAVALHDDAKLAAALATLVEADLLQQHGAGAEAMFIFKHALVQDAAYGLMVASARQQHHRRVAEVMEARFPAIVANQPELLARHFTEAAANDSAVRYWLKAGQRANARAANVEAIDHCTHGLTLLERLPAGPERDGLEVGLQITLGSASMARKAYTAPEVEQAFARALVLCEGLGDAAVHFRALMGLWTYYAVRGDYTTALPLAERMAAQAESQSAPGPRVQALYALGMNHYHMGSFLAAMEALERGRAIPCEDGDPGLLMIMGNDARVHLLAYRGMVAWNLGLPSAAWGDEAIALARRLGHPHGIGLALALAAMVRVCRMDAEGARRLAVEGLAIARDKGYGFLTGICTFAVGWATVEKSGAAQGYSQMRGGIDALRAGGALVGQTMFLITLADVAHRHGRGDVALAALAEAEKALADGPEQYSATEIFRLRAQMTGAEELFRRAIEVGNQQCNRSYMLRAAVGLATLLLKHNQSPAACAVLAPACAAFTEGLESAELSSATRLLQQLS